METNTIIFRPYLINFSNSFAANVLRVRFSDGEKAEPVTATSVRLGNGPSVIQRPRGAPQSAGKKLSVDAQVCSFFEQLVRTESVVP